MREVLTGICIMLLFVAVFSWGKIIERNKYRIELKALQAQVDKKYCKGEVIYSGPKEKFLGK